MSIRSIEEMKAEFIAKRGGRKDLRRERQADMAVKYYQEGKSLAAIGKEYGISRQRVHTILKGI